MFVVFTLTPALSLKGEGVGCAGLGLLVGVRESPSRERG